MIREHAVLNVIPGREPEFESAFATARPLIEATPGFRGLALSRSIESPSTYLLLVDWDSVDAHEVGFRGSDRYAEWRRLLHHFYDPFPVVEHFAEVAEAVPVVPRIAGAPTEDVVAEFVTALRDSSSAVSPRELMAGAHERLDSPGLYSWWVDADGAVGLSKGLGFDLEPGLIYAGQAGATRWPSGKRSSNTLWLRMATMHLAGNHEFSTFRRTLGSILAEAFGWPRIDEAALTAWMDEHLAVVTEPFDDADALGRLEDDVLAELDPALNLMKVAKTPLRTRVRALRRTHARR